jgi:hypothetical protein
MRKGTGWIALLALGMLPTAGAAQRGDPRTVAQPAQSACPPRAARAAADPNRQPGPPPGLQAYDVIVSVPNLCVERIHLEVNNLTAHLSLDAAVSNLVNIQAGADVSIGEVSLEIRGVHAQALLLIDLDNVVAVVDRTLSFVDAHPEVITQLTGTLQRTVGTVGGVANTALQPGGVVDRTVGVVGQTLNNVTQPGGVLSQTVNTLGQTVQTTLDQTGNLVERTLDTAGQVVNTRTVGALTSLPVVRQATNQAGQAVRTVRAASGALIEYTVDQAGRVLNARVVQQATGQGAPRP